jgi:hypothetical protein
MSTLFKDKSGNLTGYKLWGATIGLEYMPNNDFYIRLEARQLQMNKNQEIFHFDDENRDYRREVMLNMGISFEMLKRFETRKK